MTAPRFAERSRRRVGDGSSFRGSYKAIYELRYELNNRPDWVGIPLEGIRCRVVAEGERPVGAGAR
jgi:hypothetical protein